MGVADKVGGNTEAPVVGRRHSSGVIAIAGLMASTLLMVWGAAEETRRPWMVGGGFLASACLLLVWRSWQDWKGVSLLQVLIVGLLLRAIFLPLGGELSDDYHRYLWDGALVREGINPYAETPASLAAAGNTFVNSAEHRQWLAEMNSPEYYSIYPPVSQYVFAAAGIGKYWGLKFFFALAELMALLLLGQIVDSRKLIFYAWNPLLILETWGQPHTDALALLGIALALWAWIKRRNVLLATLGIVVAGLVKLFPLLLLPFLWRRVEASKRWGSLLLASGVGLGLWLPFVSAETLSNLLSSSHLYMLSFEFNAGPYYALKWLTTTPAQALGWLPENRDTSKVIGPLMRLLFVSGLWWLWNTKSKSQRNFVDEVTVFVALFLITFVNLHPWYLTFAVLAMPWMSTKLRLAWLWLCACSLGTYLSYSHDLYWPFVIAGWGGFALAMMLPRPAGSRQKNAAGSV